MTFLSLRRLLAVAFLALIACTTSTFAHGVANGDDDYSHLLDCLEHGSDDETTCLSLQKDCVWCPSIKSKSCCSKPGLCVSSRASQSFDADSHYQCHNNDNDDNVDDDNAPNQDDYFPSDDDATFDDDQAVDDDQANADDDASPTTDDDAHVDDDQSNTDDDANNTDDDGGADEYMKKLLECLKVGNETACAKHTPTDCVWCTTSFGEGLCVSDEAGKDIDGYFYTCQWNATFVVVEDKGDEDEMDSSVYDHYCWNAHDQVACETEVDGRDVPCVWCQSAAGNACFSQAQTDYVEACVDIQNEE